MVAHMTSLPEQVTRNCALINDLHMSARPQAKLCWRVVPVRVNHQQLLNNQK